MSHQEQKNRNFLTELAVESRKIVIFYRKSEKTGFPHPGENQNRPKTAFPHPRESQKQLKTAFPHPRENKKSAKIAFPHPGEKQKSAKTAFPPRGKSKITQRRVPQNEDPNFAPADWLYIFLKTNSLRINNMAL